MTAFNITKNVNESYSITISGFTQNTRSFARFTDAISITIASPHIITKSNIALSSACTITFATPTINHMGPVLFSGITSLKTPVTSMSYASKVVTLFVVNNFTIGDSIMVAGVNSGFSVTNIDGAWTCETGTDTTKVVFTVTDQPVGTTPQTITIGTVTGQGDCYILDPTTFITDSISYSIGNYTVYLGDWSNSYPYKVWIPFVVAIAKDTVIRLGELSLVGAIAGNTDGGALSIRIGCENSGDVAAPTNYNTLNMRTITAGYTVSIMTDISTWTAGAIYTYDITTAVQEILNHTDWVSGNTMAILILDYGSEHDKFVDIATFEHTTYTAPTLSIIG